MPARCFQCKTAVGGWGTGRQHAAITGHTWQPGYYCPHCEATFSSHKLCKSHMKTCPPRAGPALPFVTEADDTPVRAARTVSHERRTSIAAIVSCRTCGEHFRDEETLEKVCPHGSAIGLPYVVLWRGSIAKNTTLRFVPSRHRCVPYVSRETYVFSREHVIHRTHPLYSNAQPANSSS